MAEAGTVEALLTAPGAAAPMAAHDRVRLEPGRGIVGDRYHSGGGTWSAWPGDGRDLTLIAAEALEALAAEGVDLTPAQARRNVVTRGVDLEALVGVRFRLGQAECVGRRPCEPCAHLERLRGAPLLRALAHRGGLRADVLGAGDVRVGDALEPAPR